MRRRVLRSSKSQRPGNITRAYKVVVELDRGGLGDRARLGTEGHPRKRKGG
jgi:hypothetical protein